MDFSGVEHPPKMSHIKEHTPTNLIRHFAHASHNNKTWNLPIFLQICPRKLYKKKLRTQTSHSHCILITWKLSKHKSIPFRAFTNLGTFSHQHKTHYIHKNMTYAHNILNCHEDRYCNPFRSASSSLINP